MSFVYLFCPAISPSLLLSLSLLEARFRLRSCDCLRSCDSKKKMTVEAGDTDTEQRERKKRRTEVKESDMNWCVLSSSTKDAHNEACDPCWNSDLLFSNWTPEDFPPSRVRNFKFKQELIAIMALTRERSISFKEDWVHNCDFNVEDEARRLKKEMEITIQEVLEFKSYPRLVDQLKNDEMIQSNIRRVMGSHSKMQMVIYGLGSIEYDYSSQYQLALALLLKRDFPHWIGEVEVLDPILSPADCKAMEMLGCTVLTVNEQCRRRVEKPTLFYLPFLHCNRIGDLLDANWCPARLNKMVILGNSLKDMAQNLCKASTKTVVNGYIQYNSERERLDYIQGIQNHTTEIKADLPRGGYCSMFEGFAWHFFNLNTGVDMEGLLPGDIPKEIRVRLRRLYDKSFKKEKDYRHSNNMEEHYFMDPFHNTDPTVYIWSSLDRNTRRAHCLWKPPPAGWLMLNFSGIGQSGDTPAGFGGVFRDEHKDVVATFSGSLKEATGVVASAEALKQGLKCLEYMRPLKKKLLVEGDNLQIIRWVNQGPEPPAEVVEVLKLLVGIEVVARHVYEEGNSMSVELAKMGTRLPNLRVWMSPTP